MTHFKSSLLRSFFISLFFYSSLACNSNAILTSTGVKSLFIKNSTNVENKDHESQIQIGQSKNIGFEKLLTLQMDKVYESAFDNSTDEEINFSGIYFSGLRTFLLEHESDYLQIIKSVPTLGDYFESIGVNSELDIHDENVEKGLERVAELFRSGWLDHNEQDFANQGPLMGDSSSDLSPMQQSASRQDENKELSDLRKHSLMTIVGISFSTLPNRLNFALDEHSENGAPSLPKASAQAAAETGIPREANKEDVDQIIEIGGGGGCHGAAGARLLLKPCN